MGGGVEGEEEEAGLVHGQSKNMVGIRLAAVFGDTGVQATTGVPTRPP